MKPQETLQIANAILNKENDTKGITNLDFKKWVTHDQVSKSVRRAQNSTA